MFLRIVPAALLAAALCPGMTRAQATTIHDGPLSERRVSYTMDVSLDPARRAVTGRQRLTWRNPDTVPVDELQFHLYLNAFKPGSTFQVESGGVHRGFRAAEDDRWGGITVQRMRIASELPADLAGSLAYPGPEVDLTDRIRFIQPDDGNATDETVIAVTLPQAVGPGETIALDIDFESIMPRITARTGFLEDQDGRPFFFAGQWFPKIGVYEVPGQRYVPQDAERGAWNTHQFHANSEFYADFGTYDVTLTVPDSFVVGATGVRTEERSEGSTRVLRYRADDVHDFAWTAYEGYLVLEDRWEHVAIRLLLRPEHEAQADRHFEAAKIALDRFTAWVGEYPYTTLTLVDGIGGSNGMEYPTLITCGTYYGMPEWFRPVEMVTVHEFGHQYFYGLLASNEFEEAWLDEGMNSYLEARIMDDAYGPGSMLDLPGLQIADRDAQRLSYTRNSPARGALFTWSWKYRFGDYGKASYAKPATIMNTLEGYLGWDTMHRFLRTYYDRWRFRHPTTRDLQATLEEVSGEDLDWFFDQYVYGTAVVDYAVDAMASTPGSGEGGESDSVVSRVRVQRVHDGHFPVTIRARFEDGSTEDVRWDGVAEWEELTFTTASPIEEAFIDPDGLLWLETERLNNRRSTVRSNAFARKERRKFTTRLQQALYVIQALF
jgi:hypothetical protein